jgi:hypothetical protein
VPDIRGTDVVDRLGGANLLIDPSVETVIACADGALAPRTGDPALAGVARTRSSATLRRLDARREER